MKRLRDGFSGQDMYVIPRPVLAEACRHPLVRPLYPTDIGWFPAARYHYRDRPEGADEDHLMMCVGGTGFVEVGGVRNQLGTGQLLIIPRRARHTYWADDDAPWSLYWMHFRGEESEYYVGRIPGPGVPAGIDAATIEEAMRLFRDCLGALENGYTLPDLIYASQSARHILSLLLFRNRALPVHESHAERKRQLQAIMEFMHEHVTEHLTLGQLAREAGHSVSHFSEWFRDQAGQSPMACFVQLKIRHACRLLDLTDKPVKAVAMETGYDDPYYFSRVFKRLIGVSPARYREIKKG
jgi:AraC-like DNA-binding protein